MDCLCTNSLKLNILTFLDKKQIFCYENDLINKFYEETKDKIKMKKNFENLDENFIKGHIKSVIKEMIYNDKIIQEKVFEKSEFIRIPNYDIIDMIHQMGRGRSRAHPDKPV